MDSVSQAQVSVSQAQVSVSHAPSRAPLLAFLPLFLVLENV